MQQIYLSVIVPCYNEESCIKETYQRLSAVLKELSVSYEIIFVNDGSRDRTEELLIDIAKQDHSVKPVLFARNFGHQLAVTAGIDYAAGKAVILMDADLQDPPELIKDMIQLWKQGYQVVYGQRVQRDGETAFKRVTAHAFYRFLNKLSEVKIPTDTGDFRLMDRAVVDALKDMPERYRFIRGMVSWIGFKQVALPYARDSRFAGETKYPLKKMFTFALDGILSFSTKPLQVATQLGFGVSILALFGILYALYTRLFTSNWVSGWTFIVIAILFFGGVQLVALGILGEYIGRIYNEVKRRPLYIVKKNENQ